MAFAAAHAIACLPFLKPATCASWQAPQVSGVGSRAFLASSAFVCSEPWQSAQPTPIGLCRDAFQSATTCGEVFSWHVTRALVAAPDGFGFAAGLPGEVGDAASAAARARGARIMSVVSCFGEDAAARPEGGRAGGRRRGTAP